MNPGACVVTGAGGFIGYHLANALAADGRQVVGVDLRFPEPHGPLGAPRFARVVADFRDAASIEPALRGAEVVFHLASAHLQVSLSDAEYWDVNVHSLPALLQRAREAGVTRFVHTSSVGVYGDVGSTLADETTTPRPQSIYGETKLAGEKAVLEFARHHGMDVVVLRPAWVYGPGCSRTAKLQRALRSRRFLMIGAGRNLRHPLYIADMVAAFRLAASAGGAAGELLVIAGERAVTTRELVETFCAAFALPPPVIRVPYAVGVVTATVAEAFCGAVGREPPVSRRTLEFFDTNNAFDISRARACLGFTPRYSLLDGLRATRDWMALAERVPRGDDLLEHRARRV
jgi:nucleoside-diphosphate-sugar epimerase